MLETVEGLGGVARGGLREEGTSECWRVPEQNFLESPGVG